MLCIWVILSSRETKFLVSLNFCQLLLRYSLLEYPTKQTSTNALQDPFMLGHSSEMTSWGHVTVAPDSLFPSTMIFLQFFLKAGESLCGLSPIFYLFLKLSWIDQSLPRVLGIQNWAEIVTIIPGKADSAATARTSLQNNLPFFLILPFRLGINMRFQFEKCYTSKLLLYRQEDSLSLQQITLK